MTSITAEELKQTLESQVYPYEIKFFTYEPRFPIYPYCMVRKSQPQGSIQTITDTTKQEGFEVTLFIRYTRKQEDEERDQTDIEDIILSALEGQDFGASALFSETKTWQRSPLQRLYGVQSRIVINIIDKASTSGSGILGYTDIVELNSNLTPVQIKCLSYSEVHGAMIETHNNDTGLNLFDPSVRSEHTITFTYESTLARDTLLKTLAESRDEVYGKMLRGGTTTNYKFYVGRITKSGQFDNIERATTTLYITDTW